MHMQALERSFSIAAFPATVLYLSASVEHERACRDKSTVFVGFDWDSSDQHKFQRTFRKGKEVMRRFYDSQAVSVALGYHNHGLASLAHCTLQVNMAKSKKVKLKYSALMLLPLTCVTLYIQGTCVDLADAAVNSHESISVQPHVNTSPPAKDHS